MFTDFEMGIFENASENKTFAWRDNTADDGFAVGWHYGFGSELDAISDAERSGKSTVDVCEVYPVFAKWTENECAGMVNTYKMLRDVVHDFESVFENSGYTVSNVTDEDIQKLDKSVREVIKTWASEIDLKSKVVYLSKMHDVIVESRIKRVLFSDLEAGDLFYAKEYSTMYEYIRIRGNEANALNRQLIAARKFYGDNIVYVKVKGE